MQATALTDRAGSLDRTVYFPNLDGLRFLAFLLVYLQHGYGLNNAGAVGVSFFFVLSGFLITYLILLEIERNGALDVGAFYVRRALRIWPLYYALLVFSFLIYPTLARLSGSSSHPQNGRPLWYALFLANFEVLGLPWGQGAGFINVTWSVSIEEQFYLAWPLLFRIVPRTFHPLVLVVVLLGSFLFRLTNDDPRVLYFHSLSVISDMAIGGSAAYLWRYVPAYRAMFLRLTGRAIGTTYAVAAILFLSAADYFGPYSRILTASFFAFVVTEQNFSEHSLFKMSAAPTLSKLGRYTYGLYLLHSIALMCVTKLAARSGWDLSYGFPHFVVATAGLLLSILMARLSYASLESPFLKLKDHFSRLGVARGRSRTAPA